MNQRLENLVSELPDPAAGRRFLSDLTERSNSAAQRLLKNDALASDVLTLVSFSPLLATTLLQNPDYLAWLDRKRRESGVKSRDELLEAFGQFALTNSQVEPQVLFARFRRRELLRIFLRDIRRLATVAEITEEISVLADAILEAALQLSLREMDNRFGQPLETDDKGRATAARFCIVALGKLGSRELNYSSDIDLLFLYSAEGSTSGNGTRGTVTNREYFVKLAEYLTKLVGQPSGEGAAYRVDLRLRPHGSLGPLAQSVSDMVRYYSAEARPWERQVMIRSRACAGDVELFRSFFARIEGLVFLKEETPASALANVRRSKERIDEQQTGSGGYDVKLGRGGIREIEFIAQALQLAYGGGDPWLRAPHTLISLDRLKDRGLLTEAEMTDLVSAYEFLRRTEHILQMENGVQTHTIPEDPERRSLLAKRISFAGGGELEKDLQRHTKNVERIFYRVLPKQDEGVHDDQFSSPADTSLSRTVPPDETDESLLHRLRKISPHFASVAAAHPGALDDAGKISVDGDRNYREVFQTALAAARGDNLFRAKLGILREVWLRSLLGIVSADVFGELDLATAKRRQTELAEASIGSGLEIVREELERKYKAAIPELKMAVLGLGKLGGGAVDYDSDLDLIFVYDEEAELPPGTTHVEFFARAAELFVTTMSSVTREGSVYRIDLRLRPYGSKGLSAIGASAFLDYMQEKAAVWEMLAFVKLRAVGGDLALATHVESQTRHLIHHRALHVDPEILRSETVAVRAALYQQRAKLRRGTDVDIKYGEGGMLDVYFSMRYLQLLWNLPDIAEDRSTLGTLDRLLRHERGPTELLPSLTALSEGYRFLSALDHNIRLTVGRTTRLPAGNELAMETIAARLGFDAPKEMVEQLTLHRLGVHAAYERILEIES